MSTELQPRTLPGAHFAVWEWNSKLDQVHCKGDHALLSIQNSGLERLLDSVHADDRPAFESALRLACKNSSPLVHESRNRSGDGRLLWRGRNEDADRMIGIVVEGSSARDPETETLERRVAAAEADFNAFAYAVSHDLRAPLRAIGGFSEVLLESEPGTFEDSARRYLPRIVAATRHMSALLEDLLQLSRLNRVTFNPNTLDLVPLAQEAIDALRKASPQRDVEVRLPASAPAWGDKVLLQAVLKQLLSNAWKFTRNTEHARIAFGTVLQEDQVAYYVQDNGVGYDPSQAGKLFQPMQRLHRPDEFEGSGVGLTIVRRAVERHGGRVWAELVPEGGACFWFMLPRVKNSGES